MFFDFTLGVYLKGGEFYRLVIVHNSRLRSYFAFGTLLLKLKTCK